MPNNYCKPFAKLPSFDSSLPYSQNLDDLPPSAEDLTFGNSVYKIRFEDRKRRPVFGHKYWFFLQDAVEDVPEYIVHWDHFVQWVVQTYMCGVELTIPH